MMAQAMPPPRGLRGLGLLNLLQVGPISRALICGYRHGAHAQGHAGPLWPSQKSECALASRCMRGARATRRWPTHAHCAPIPRPSIGERVHSDAGVASGCGGARGVVFLLVCVGRCMRGWGMRRMLHQAYPLRAILMLNACCSSVAFATSSLKRSVSQLRTRMHAWNKMRTTLAQAHAC